MEVVASKGMTIGAPKTYAIREGLKRYWQTDIWGDCFYQLLNPLLHVEEEADGRLPLINRLRVLRTRMEDFLESHSEKGLGLKAHLRRLESAVRERRR